MKTGLKKLNIGVLMARWQTAVEAMKPFPNESRYKYRFESKQHPGIEKHS